LPRLIPGVEVDNLWRLSNVENTMVNLPSGFYFSSINFALVRSYGWMKFGCKLHPPVTFDWSDHLKF
jgi:hypothetical protein